MEIREFELGTEKEISDLIRRTLVEVNSVDCPKWEIDYLYEAYTPERIIKNAAEGHTYVLWEDGKIIGTGTIGRTGERESEIFAAFLLPEYIGKGYGRKLLNHSFEVAKQLGYDTIVIWGNPENYACYGFKNCKRYHVCLEEDVYPVALMVNVLEENALSDKSWKYVESSAHQLDESGFEEFDSSFPQMEKGYKYTQELFYIYSRSNVLR